MRHTYCYESSFKKNCVMNCRYLTWIWHKCYCSKCISYLYLLYRNFCCIYILVSIMTQAMDQKLEKLKRSMEGRFYKQWISLKGAIKYVCSALFGSFKRGKRKSIWKSKLITKMTSENHVLQKQRLKSYGNMAGVYTSDLMA